jgi:ribonucleoside-triphosphate reductase
LICVRIGVAATRMKKNTTDMSLYSEIIHLTRYARYNDENGRREVWPETVDRLVEFFVNHLKKKLDFDLDEKTRSDLHRAVLNFEIMPSMRALMTAGKPLETVNVANFNCTYLVVDCIRAFSEHMYCLMCGSGVGFSVESKFTNKLPEVPEELLPAETTIKVADSRKGWCAATNQLLTLLYAGNIPELDVSKLRPEGARLKTFGGYSSGPAVLVELYHHIIKIFKGAKGRKLKPIEVFSIMTYIAQIVVVGGVRRSATIAIFDKDDWEMRNAKTGQWWKENAHFAMANISAVFENKPDVGEFLEIWSELIQSGSGEPGIINRGAFWDSCTAIDRSIRDEHGDRYALGPNPCAEIILRPNQMCNLSGIAIRPNDSRETLLEKVRLATILGTFQSTVTDFEYLRKIWQKNVEEERLLGVCLAGVMDHPILSQVSQVSADLLQEMQAMVWETNKKWAKKLDIEESTSVTAIKPAGNSGELYAVGNGIHPRYAPYYVRTIRETAMSPICKFLKSQGIPWEVSKQNSRDVVFSFPQKSPEGAICADQLSAIDQLNHWLHVKKHWATHTVSCSVYIKREDWLQVAAWVYENFNEVTGLSFFPYDDHVYEQAPYQKIDKDTYIDMMQGMPAHLNYDDLLDFEKTDNTATSQEFACSSATGCAF